MLFRIFLVQEMIKRECSHVNNEANALYRKHSVKTATFCSINRSLLGIIPHFREGVTLQSMVQHLCKKRVTCPNYIRDGLAQFSTEQNVLVLCKIFSSLQHKMLCTAASHSDPPSSHTAPISEGTSRTAEPLEFVLEQSESRKNLGEHWVEKS